jgi:hypothetical protein
MCVLQGRTEWHSHKRRTGPATHTPKSLASLSWSTRSYRASGQPSCGKRLRTHTRGSASAAREQKIDGGSYKRENTGGGAYKGLAICIAKSEGGTLPSSRFPTRSLQPNGGSTAEAKPTRSELVGGQAWARTGT